MTADCLFMSWMVSNWIERRAARERHLRDASGVWRSAQASIEEACDTLHQYYADVAIVRRTKQNDNILLVAITQVGKSSTTRADALRTNLVSFEFRPEPPVISVAVNGIATQEFPIDADPDHAFITLSGHEVLLDDFSRFALEEAFFTPPIPKHRQQDPDKALEMARELIKKLDAESNEHMKRVAEKRASEEKNAA